MVTPEDLMNLVIAADTQRRSMKGFPPSKYHPAQRVWVEPLFNFFGNAVGVLINTWPWRWRQSFFLWMCERMSGHASEINPQLPSRVAQSAAMARSLQERTGEWPAVLLLTSHGETVGPHAWIRFEVIRQALGIAGALAEANHPASTGRPKPQCFLAIDPYALDTVSAIVGGLYAGLMRQVHLAWDRQPSTQSWIQKHWLLRKTDYKTIAWELLKRLRANVPVIMVFSGGLPTNARLLYAAREFAQNLKAPRRPHHRRDSEKKLMEILMAPSGKIRPPEQGEIPDDTLVALRKWFAEMGISDVDQEAELSRLEEEFKRPVPYRRRLLSVLLSRVVKKGKPLLFVNLSHAEEAPHVRVAPPVGVYKASDGSLEIFSDGDKQPSALSGAGALAQIIGRCF
jgi:hypothetical protein